MVPIIKFQQRYFLSDRCDITLPDTMQLQTELDSFESFYKQQHDGRRISWCFDRFRVHLKCWLSDTLYEIVGSFAQISVLLCFEKVDTCHIDNLRQRTGIAVDVLRTIAAVRLFAALAIYRSLYNLS